ncbi:MAG TPA: hypothetical protein VGQ51_08840 [Puia sp.]|jgi:hypothetical protein|nr:hypothetical protein [Puia sp.]
MLHAKDLRFGNKVLNRRGEVITVQQIHSNSIVYDTAISVSRRHLSKVSGYDATYTAEVLEVVKEAGLREIEPIVLTPKVLEKCGFRNFIREEWIVTYGNKHTDFEFTEDGLRLKHPSPSRVGIKYLHQLQNFFYAIAGEELQIEL